MYVHDVEMRILLHYDGQRQSLCFCRIISFEAYFRIHTKIFFVLGITKIRYRKTSDRKLTTKWSNKANFYAVSRSGDKSFLLLARVRYFYTSRMLQ